jgi:hypothetical protein
VDDESDPRGALVYAEAIRTLESQARQLDEIRNRAGILLAASSIATSFLAKMILPKDGDNLSILSTLAGLTFLFAAGLCVWLLLPRGKWRFRMDGAKAIRVALDARPQPPLVKIHRDFSKQMDSWATANETELLKMLDRFGWASAALGIEVALWVADLVVRRWT